jgi:hypothetical protein
LGGSFGAIGNVWHRKSSTAWRSVNPRIPPMGNLWSAVGYNLCFGVARGEPKKEKPRLLV